MRHGRRQRLAVHGKVVEAFAGHCGGGQQSQVHVCRLALHVVDCLRDGRAEGLRRPTVMYGKTAT